MKILIKWLAPWVSLMIHWILTWFIDSLNNPPVYDIGVDWILVPFYILVLTISYLYILIYTLIHSVKAKYKMVPGFFLLFILILYLSVTTRESISPLNNFLYYLALIGTYGIPFLYLLYYSDENKHK